MQSDLGLLSAHMPEDKFSHDAIHIYRSIIMLPYTYEAGQVKCALAQPDITNPLHTTE